MLSHSESPVQEGQHRKEICPLFCLQKDKTVKMMERHDFIHTDAPTVPPLTAANTTKSVRRFRGGAVLMPLLFIYGWMDAIHPSVRLSEKTLFLFKTDFHMFR